MSRIGILQLLDHSWWHIVGENASEFDSNIHLKLRTKKTRSATSDYLERRVPEIPEKYEITLKELLYLEETSFSELLIGLTRVKPSLSYTAVLQDIGTISGINTEKTKRLLELAIWLGSLEEYYFQTSGWLELMSTVKEQLSLEASSNRLIVKRLSELVQNNAIIRLIASAADILSDNRTNFQEARILSEIRPVFGTVEEKPLAAVIVHNFKIVHYENFRNRELFFTLETKDLLTIQKVITRAIKKSEQLRAVLASADISCLESEESHE
jgi:hypothetical protein